jgi:hypothetical protein
MIKPLSETLYIDLQQNPATELQTTSKNSQKQPREAMAP